MRRRTRSLDATFGHSEFSLHNHVAARSSDAREAIDVLCERDQDGRAGRDVDDMRAALAKINPLFAQAIALHTQGIPGTIAGPRLGILPDTFRSRVCRGMKQIRRWFSGERPSKMSGWCHVHRDGGTFVWWYPPSGAPRRRRCVTCREERRAKGRHRKTCRTCGRSDQLVLRTHTKTKKRWLECRRCKSAYARAHRKSRCDA